MFRKFWIAATLVAASTATSSAFADSAEETAMAQKIATQLKHSGQLKNYRLGVKFQDGTAYLLGNVTDPGQEKTAVSLTKKMPGVRQVISKLDVANSTSVAELADTEEDALNYAESLQLASAEMKQQNQPGVSGSPRALDGTRDRGVQPSRRQASPSNRPMPARRIPPQAMAGNANRPRQMAQRRQAPVPYARQAGPRQANYTSMAAAAGPGMAAAPAGAHVPGGTPQAAGYDQGHMPGYAWPTYASYPNYAALTYPQQYSPSAWPYIGPFHPYPQVPLGWRKVSLEWDDGWWFLDFNDTATH